MDLRAEGDNTNWRKPPETPWRRGITEAHPSSDWPGCTKWRHPSTPRSSCPAWRHGTGQPSDFAKKAAPNVTCHNEAAGVQHRLPSLPSWHGCHQKRTSTLQESRAEGRSERAETGSWEGHQVRVTKAATMRPCSPGKGNITVAVGRANQRPRICASQEGISWRNRAQIRLATPSSALALPLWWALWSGPRHVLPPWWIPHASTQRDPWSARGPF